MSVDPFVSLREAVRDMMAAAVAAPEDPAAAAPETNNGDPAHDMGHIMRVYKNAEDICQQEPGADKRLVLAAALLHDIVSYPKSDKRSKNSSAESAKRSEEILRQHGFSEREIGVISEAIRDHSFSRHATPATLEGKVLQDADRLDAIGAVGIARVFATAGRIGRPLYSPDDPFCTRRAPDDLVWTLDHFYKKLLRLESLMNTDAGRAEAKQRTSFLKEYLDRLRQELGG